jgi:hypothetical protein
MGTGGDGVPVPPGQLDQPGPGTCTKRVFTDIFYTRYGLTRARFGPTVARINSRYKFACPTRVATLGATSCIAGRRWIAP